MKPVIATRWISCAVLSLMISAQANADSYQAEPSILVPDRQLPGCGWVTCVPVVTLVDPYRQGLCLVLSQAGQLAGLWEEFRVWAAVLWPFHRA